MTSENPAPDANEWVERELARCIPYIIPAIEQTHGETTLEQVCEDIRTGQAQIWPTPNGCAITRLITQEDGRKVCHVWLAGGELSELLYIREHHIAPWAREKACERMTIAGRPGWLRAMKSTGLKLDYVVMGLEL